MTEDSANQFLTSARKQWAELVKIGVRTPPRHLQNAATILASGAGVGKSNLYRKLVAIHTAHDSGLSEDTLVEKGQRWVLAKFQNDKRAARTDSQVVLKWMVAPELRDAAIANSVRVARLLKFTTSNEYWAWLNAQIELATDEEIIHAAGMMK